MGRDNTGAWTTRQAIRIELAYLLKNGYIRKNCEISANLSWTDGSKINIETMYSEKEKYIRLVYTVTSKQTCEKIDYDYKIELITKPSNLGKGEIIFFKCPESSKSCRILYRCYGSHTWKSRTAYKQRIYYPLQIMEKLAYPNLNYWKKDEQINSLRKKWLKPIYQGKKTKTMLKIERLEKRKDHFDNLRWRIFPKNLALFDEELWLDFLYSAPRKG